MRFLHTFFLFISYCSFCFAQPTAFRWREEKGNRYIGLNLSTSRYCGDLSKRYNIRHLQLGWGAELHGRYRLDEQWCIRADVGGYYVWADQRNMIPYATDYVFFSATNLSANVGIQWDVRPVDDNLWNIPYLFIGLGATFLKPKATLNGVGYSLPLYEIEEETYPLGAYQFNYGMGFPVTLNAATQLRLEGRYTHVSSDYLDDVSGDYANKVGVAALLQKQVASRRISQGPLQGQMDAMRGNADKNDEYFLLTLQLVHKF